MEQIERGHHDQRRARGGFQREMRNERFARACRQDHDAATAGDFPRGECLRLVRMRDVGTGEVQREIGESAGLVLDDGALGGERLYQWAVVVGVNAEALDAVVPLGVFHPGPAARRWVEQQRAAIIGKDGGTWHRETRTPLTLSSDGRSPNFWVSSFA